MNTTTIHRLLAATVLFASAVALAAPDVTATHATVKVRPTDEPPGHIPVELVAARNEFVSFQVVIHAKDGAAKNVSASFPGLSGPGQIPQQNVTLYREAYLNLTRTSFPEAPTGLYPDALIPDVDETVGEKRNAFPFDVPRGENRVLWVDVLVPLDAPAGRYRGTLTVQGDGFESRIPVAVTVLNTELPSTSSIDSAFLFSRNQACQVHTGAIDCGSQDASYDLTTKYVKLGLEHRISLTNTINHPENGDWATFDQWYAPWFEGTLPTRLPGARLTSVTYPWGQRTASQFAAFEQHFREKGWLDILFDYTGDEPPYGISFSEALSKAQQVKAAAPGLRTLLTTTIQETDRNGLTQYLDLIVPVVNHIDGIEPPYVGDQRAAYDEWLASDPANELWIYQSCMSHGCAYGTNAPGNKPGQGWPSYMVDASAARNRAMQWQVFLSRATGELYYETALALDTAWNDIFRFNGNGDGTLFYPGTPDRIGGTTHVGLPSLRLKMIRQGMQDYEWLKKLSDMGDDAFARQVARELIPAASQVGDNGALFEAARLKLISRWLDAQPTNANPVRPPTLPPADDPKLDPMNPDGTPINPGGPGLNAPGGGGSDKRSGCSAAGSGAVGLGALVALSAASHRRRRRRR